MLHHAARGSAGATGIDDAGYILAADPGNPSSVSEEQLAQWRGEGVVEFPGHVDEIAKLLTMEQGKPVGEAKMEILAGADIIDWFAEEGKRAYGRVIPARADGVLQAVQAQAVLKSSRGALMWHGRDLRHFKRLISPPLQALLTAPGTAVLGRGLASIPAATAIMFCSQIPIWKKRSGYFF